MRQLPAFEACHGLARSARVRVAALPQLPGLHPLRAAAPHAPARTMRNPAATQSCRAVGISWSAARSPRRGLRRRWSRVFRGVGRWKRRCRPGRRRHQWRGGCRDGARDSAHAVSPQVCGRLPQPGSKMKGQVNRESLGYRANGSHRTLHRLNSNLGLRYEFHWQGGCP